MAEGDLTLQILGEVSDKLIKGLQGLRKELEQLAKTAKRTSNVDLGNGLQRVANQADQMATNVKTALDSANKRLQQSGEEFKKAGAKSKEGADDVAKAVERMGDETEDAADANDDAVESLRVRNDLEAVFKAKLGKSAEAEKEAKRRAAELTDQIVRMHRALGETTELKSSQKNLDDFANSLELSELASKSVTGEIKKTGDGFRAYSDDVAAALGITKEQNDALKRFTGPEVYQQKLEELQREERQGSEEARKYINALKYLGQQFGTSDKEANQYVHALDNVRTNVERLTVKAKAMNRVDLAENIQQIRPASAVIKHLNGSLDLTKKNMKVVSNEAKSMFKGMGTKKIDDLIQQLDMVPSGTRNIRKLREEFDRLTSEDVDVTALEGLEFDKYEKDVKSLRSQVDKLSDELKQRMGDEAFQKMRDDVYKTDKAVKEHRKSISEAIAEQKRQQKAQEQAEQQLKELRTQLDKLEKANHEAFDSEDTRKWKSEISTVESQLKKIKQYVPDEEFQKLTGRISEARREAERYKTTMRKAAEGMDTRGQRDAMLALAKQYGSTTNRINKYKKAVREVAEFDQRRMDQILEKIDRLRRQKRQNESVRHEIARLTKQYDELANETNMSTRAQQRYEEQLRGVSKNHSHLNQELDSTKREMGFVEEQIDHIGRRIKQFGAFIAAAFVLQRIQRFFREFVNVLSEFDQAMHNLQAIMKITTDQSAVLGDTIKDVARATKFSANEVAKGVQTLGQAGLSMREAVYAIEGVTTLATGTLSDFSTVSDLATTTLNAFNLAATEATRVADIFANAINNSKLSVDKLSTAFNYVGAAGNQVGLSLNELTGTLMTLADNGLRASTMGTGLRRMMLKMVNPADELVSHLHAMDKTAEALNPKIVGWQTALKNLTPILWDANRETVDMAKATEFFGTRAAQVAAVIVRNVSDGSQAIDRAIQKTFEYGAASRMAETQIEGLGLKIKNLGDRLRLVIQAAGDAGATGALKSLVDVLREASVALEDFLKQQQAASQITGIAMSVGLLTGLMSGLAPVVARLAVAWKTLRIQFSAFFKGMAIWTAAITAIIFSLQKLTNWNYSAAEAAGKNAQEHAALADTFQKWGEQLDKAFGTDKWENTVKRFEDVEVAGKNLSEMLKEELTEALGFEIRSLEDLKELENGFEVLQNTINDLSTEQLEKQLDASLRQMEKTRDAMRDLSAYTGAEFSDKLAPEIDMVDASEAERNTKWLRRYGKAVSSLMDIMSGRLPGEGAGAQIFGWFGPDKQELMEQFENSMKNTISAVYEFAQINEWNLRETNDVVQEHMDAIINKFGETSEQANKFRESMTEMWFQDAFIQAHEFGAEIDGLKEKLEMQWGKEEFDLEPALEYARNQMDLTADEAEKMVHRLRRAEQNLSMHGTSMFSAFLAGMKRVSPEIKSTLDDLTDTQISQLYAQQDEIYTAGEDLRKAYESVFGSSLETIEKNPEKYNIAQKLKDAGFDARTIEDMLDSVKNKQKEKLEEILADLQEAGESFEDLREEMHEAYKELTFGETEERLKDELDRQLEAIDRNFERRKELRKRNLDVELELEKENADAQLTTIEDQNGNIIGAYNKLVNGVIDEKEKEKTKIVQLTKEEMDYMRESYKQALSPDTQATVGALEDIYRQASSINEAYSFDEFVQQWSITAKQIESIEKGKTENLVDMEKSMMDKILGEIERPVEEAEDAAAERVNIKKNEAGEIVAWERKLGNDLVKYKRDAATGILKITTKRIEDEQQALEQSTKNAYDDLAKEEERWLEKRTEAVEKNYKKRIVNLDAHIAEEKEKAKKRHRALIDARNDYFEDVEAANEELHEKENDLDQERTEEFKRILEDRKQAYEDMLDDRYEKAKNIQDKIAGIEDDLYNLERDRQDALDKIREKNMSEYEKYKKNEERVAELTEQNKKLLAEGTAASLRRAVENTKEMENASYDLNQEIKDGERVLVGQTQAQEKAEKIANQAFKTRKQALQALKEVYQNQLKEVRQQITDIGDRIGKLQEKIIDVTEEVFNIRIDAETVGASEKVARLKRELDELFSYDGETITINVETPPKGSKLGGMIDNIRSRFQTGGGIPGFGGGDKVKALLEPGEYVIRKEAVRKYGSALFEALNQMKVGADSMLGSIKSKLGGEIPKINIPSPRVAFQGGGMPQNIPNLGSLNLFVEGESAGKIYGEPDVLNALSKQYERKRRLRRNN